MTREDGAIGAFNAYLARIDKARARGEDIGLAEFDRIARRNALAAWKTHRLYHYLGPRDGNEMPESALGWFGDPAVNHEPGVEQVRSGFQPTCSCGFRALLASGTEEAALKRARVHAEVSSPRPESRYVLDAYDAWGAADRGIEVRLHCREHGAHSLLKMAGAPSEHQAEIAAAIRDHDREFHGGDEAP